MTSTLAQSVETRSRWGFASCLLLLAVAPLAACESQSPMSDPTVKVEGVTPSGFLEDYSFVADGLVSLYEATFERRWLDAALELANEMIALFW